MKKKRIKLKNLNEQMLDNKLSKYNLDFKIKDKYKSKLKKLEEYYKNNYQEYEKYLSEKEKYTYKYWRKINKQEILKKLEENNYYFDKSTPKRLLIELIILNLFFESKTGTFSSKKEYKKIKNIINRKSKIERQAKSYQVKKRVFRKDFFKTLNKYIGKYKYGYQLSNYEIELKNINKFFINESQMEHILKDINLKISKSNLLIIRGPSGSGKTTIVNIISGLLIAEGGEAIIANHNLKYLNEKERTKFREENISFVFQSYNLIPTLTIKDNILLGKDFLKNKKDALNIKELVKNLGIEEQLNKFPHQLSGGQKQRASIARALIKNPKILIADEPTGALDKKTGRDVIKIFQDVIEKYKTTIVFVTHNPEIVKIGNFIMEIKNGKIDNFYKNKHIESAENLKLEV